jgi:hypothetical protein
MATRAFILTVYIYKQLHPFLPSFPFPFPFQTMCKGQKETSGEKIGVDHKAKMVKLDLINTIIIP